MISYFLHSFKLVLDPVTCLPSGTTCFFRVQFSWTKHTDYIIDDSSNEISNHKTPPLPFTFSQKSQQRAVKQRQQNSWLLSLHYCFLKDLKTLFERVNTWMGIGEKESGGGKESQSLCWTEHGANEELDPMTSRSWPDWYQESDAKPTEPPRSSLIELFFSNF